MYRQTTKDESKRTNHWVQSSQPMTHRLNWHNNITTSLTNHINNQSIYTIYWHYTNHLTLMMTTLSRMIVLYLAMIRLLRSNHLQYCFIIHWLKNKIIRTVQFTCKPGCHFASSLTTSHTKWKLGMIILRNHGLLIWKWKRVQCIIIAISIYHPSE